MGRQVKCQYCDIHFDKDISVKHGKGYYHESCYKEWRSKVNPRKELIRYLCRLYGIKAPTGKMLKQIKQYEKEYNLKVEGMRLSLEYFHETLGHPVRQDGDLDIVPYIYEEAKRHYIARQKAKKIAEDKLLHQRPVREVTIKLNEIPNKKTFDISSL
ncbi:hypothetical protein A9D36_09645 [Bacillus subtilis]|nr:hypothetical protein A9D36_09645 [Bacillus subtilis]